jgi:drug/metabolite transporter (DMT)-like permease
MSVVLAPAAPARPVAGLAWMILSGLSFVGVNVIVKYVGQSVPPSQAAFLRYALGLVFVLPLIPAMLRGGFGAGLLGRFAARGVAQTCGTLLWFFAMTSIPIGEVSAMGYMQPVYLTIGAVLFLGERIALRRVAAILCAILGAMIVLRPGFRELMPGHLAMLAVPAFNAASYLLAKRLAETTSAAATLGWMSVMVTVFLAPVAWVVWKPVSAADLGWMFATAAFATGGHYAMLRAFRIAPITVTQPATALGLVWSVTVGALLFHEPVDAWVVLGGGVIIGSVLFIAWREARLRRPRPVAALG